MLWQARQGLIAGRGAIDATAGGGSLGLQTSLTGFWSFENTSWTDDTGNGTTLSLGGSATTATGIVGNAVSLNGSTDYLTASSNTNILNGGASFSAQCWVNVTANAGNIVYLFNKNNNAFGQIEWGFGTKFTTGNVWNFTVYNTSSSNFDASAAASGAGLYASSSWRHLVGTFDSSTGAVVLYVNGSASGAGATLTGTMQSTASAPLNVGRRVGGPFATGLIDQCGFWKGRVLSAGDVTLLYNSGAGLTYAAMA